jgi:flavoprotein
MIMNKRRKIAWGITGSGEKLEETVEIMQQMRDMYHKQFDIRVYISFDKTWTEINSNAPFLAGQIQLGKYAFLLIAPATSNTVAKVSLRIADTLLTNAAIMGQKTSTPLYIMPTDFREGIVTTKLPNGRDLDLKITREDAQHVEKLAQMDTTKVFESPSEIPAIFKRHALQV